MRAGLSEYDAIVVGSGPNGLAAAIVLARAGRSVLVLEASETIGGGMRSAELTRPGFVHDVCSAIHPMALGSPFLRELPLAEHGLELVHPPSPLAHPFDDGTAAILERSVEATAEGLGADAESYRRLMRPLAGAADAIIGDVFGPLRVPRHPLATARFGLVGLRSAAGLASRRFETERARGLFAGVAGHSMMPLTNPITAAAGLVLGLMGHAFGWPLARGGSQRIADAMGSLLRELGGEIATVAPGVVDCRASAEHGDPVRSHPAPGPWDRRATGFRPATGAGSLATATARACASWTGPSTALSPGAPRAAAARARCILGRPSRRSPAPRPRSGTAGTRSVPTCCSRSRARSTRRGRPTASTRRGPTVTCQAASPQDMSERIEAQVERFAPGFRDLILDRSVITATEIERYNANYVGGDINGGIQDVRQLFTRPTARLVPYATPARGVYICSSSTPPGGGVHGMCGYFAARAALRRELAG